MVAAIVKFYNNIKEKKKSPFQQKTPKVDRPLTHLDSRTPTKETGFLLNLSSSTQYCRKNPVSKILINDCARVRHENENARALHENARARENARAPHENGRALHENDCARDAPPNSD